MMNRFSPFFLGGVEGGGVKVDEWGWGSFSQLDISLCHFLGRITSWELVWSVDLGGFDHVRTLMTHSASTLHDLIDLAPRISPAWRNKGRGEPGYEAKRLRVWVQG